MVSGNQTKFKQTEIGEIPETWQVKELGKLIEIKHGYAFKGKYFSESETEYILLTPGNVAIGGGFSSTKFKYYNGEIPKDYVLKEGQMFINMTDLSKAGDTLGYSAKVPNLNNKTFLHNQRLGLVSLISNEILEDYIYWALRSDIYRQQILGSATGSTVKHTSPDRIKKTSIPIPSVEEQKQIVSIFSSIDDKIELNQKTIRTLEEIGQVLFKRWFVDFEFPNEKRETYKSSGGEMVDSELGEIPKGWSVEKIADNLNICGGSTPSTTKNEYWLNGNICWATPKDLSSLKNPILENTEKKITQEGLKGISSGLLPAGSILLSSRAPIGYLAINTIPTAINQGFIGIKCDKDIPSYYCYFWLKNNLELIKGYANGSTFLEISKSNFRCISFVKPQQKLFNEFQKIISPMFENIIVNQKEIGELSLLRDSLLPKLLSGKIRV